MPIINRVLIISFLCLVGMQSAMASFFAPNASYVMHIEVGSSCWAVGDCSGGAMGLFTDNNNVVNLSGTDYGSSINGDGWAGVITFTTDATGNNFTVNTYSQDGRPFSPPDGLVFFTDTPELMTGSITAGGAMTFIPASRMAISSTFAGSIGVQPWNFDDSSAVTAPTNTWEPLTTGTSTSEDTGSGVLSLTGSPLTTDGSGGWNARLVTAGNMGEDWLFFAGQAYTEIWDVHIEVDTDADGVGNILDANDDNDGYDDVVDNCTLVSNDQLDTDSDGYGNACDADFNGDNIVNSFDLGLFKTMFFTTGVQDGDMNGDSIVNSLDLGAFKKSFLKQPGPSGLNP